MALISELANLRINRCARYCLTGNEEARGQKKSDEITVSAPFLRALVALAPPSLLARKEPTRLSHQAALVQP
jgi:hypothetical protein